MTALSSPTEGKARPGDENYDGESRTVRLAAIVATIIMHALLGKWLLTGIHAVDVSSSGADESIRLVLLPRNPQNSREPPPKVSPSSEPGHQQAARSRKSPHEQRTEATPRIPDGKPVTLGAPFAQPLDLRMPASVANDRLQFQSSLTGRRNVDQFDRAPKVALRLQDRSLGGRLHSMRQAAMCGELRQAAAEALRTGGGSRLTVIEQSMQDHGCHW